MLKIFKDLFQSLQINEIQFCNWKGHHTVERHLRGDGDLDLFVPLSFKDQFEEISNEVGFRRVISVQANHEFIEHYYGFDEGSFKFAHIHVYFKLVTGEHVSKNYILPLEKYLMENQEGDELLPLINEKAKRSIFLIRYFLKIGSVYGIVQYLKEKNKYSFEWESFQKIDSYKDIPELNLSGEELEYYEQIYESLNPVKLILASINLKENLKTFRRKTYLDLLIFELKNLIQRLINKYFTKKKKILDPGLVVAVCGLDGSGKSSIVEALRKNFSENFSVKTYHLGRPRSNCLTLLINPLIIIYSLFKRFSKKKEGQFSRNKRISLVYAFRSLLLAYDRKIESQRAHRFGKKGYLVICDRYPGIITGKMDCPRIYEDPKRGSLYKFCYRLEKSLYMSIRPADAIMHLSVPLDEAIRRNNKREKFGKETGAELHERYNVNSDVKFLAEDYHHIDATVPFREVLLVVTSLIWNFKLK